MKIYTMRERQIGATLWVDVTEPSSDDLLKLAERFSLPSSPLLAASEADHLPSIDVVEGVTFAVLRGYDLDSGASLPTIQDMTRKLTLVMRPGLILTLHRTNLPYVQAVMDACPTEFRAVPDLILRLIRTYDSAVKEIYREFDSLEEEILHLTRPVPSGSVQRLYELKRRTTLLKRIIQFLEDPLDELAETLPLEAARNSLQKSLFQLEEAYDNLIAVLSLQVSISAQRTNEIMRTLTVYSILFLPLNLIAGIYGMNFEHMPELRSEHGYHFALFAMATVAVMILFWLKRRGWLERP